MAAVTTWESGWDEGHEAPSLYLLPPVSPARRARSRASVYRRRRLLAAVLAVGLVLAARWVLGGLDGGPLTAAGPARASAPMDAPAPRATRVVQPGDTLWTIARSLQHDGDVRPLVTRLARARAGAPLRVGERIALP